MSDLSYRERVKLERLLGMGGGYVLDFTNQTFTEFVLDSTGRDIYDEKYEYASGSKANRLRAFWEKEANHVAAKLTGDLLEYYAESRPGADTKQAVLECRSIVTRLLDSSAIDALDAVVPDDADRSFDILAREVKGAIEHNKPEAGLDRLHTFTCKLIRSLASCYGIATPRDKPLHSTFGEYVKALRSARRIESDMTDRILKSTISTLEAFGHVRNNASLAHDNPALNYNESLLIFNHVCNVVRFLREVDPASTDVVTSDREQEPEESDDEIPF